VLNLKFVASVAEKDIDLILMEEFSVNEEFRDWFAARVFGAPTYKEEVGAWHSVSSADLGESDLVFICSSQADHRIGFLIENKIDAPPQPKQGQRYRLRGDRGRIEGYWDEYKTCVIAPSRYLESAKHSETYDIEISYEEILSFFSSRRFRDLRYLYKAKMIQEGIEQNRRGYQPEISKEMTQFVIDYYAFASSQFPQLGMQEPRPRPAGSTWIMFYPKNYKEKGVSLCHQMTAGFVKAMFSGMANKIEEIRERYSKYLTDEIQANIAGKSAAFEIKVREVAPTSKDFSDERENVVEALRAVSKLDTIIRTVEGI
jgi:hypothetical protein